jgi:hypothetical protein
MPDTSPSRSIFISYRRDDAGGEAGRLFDDLTRAFGAATVFMDVAGIQPGIDFRQAIDQNVAAAGVLLAVIGPTWLTVADATGSHRIENPNDFVRLEIASALQRNIPVIPVLVHGASMPAADAMPDDLKDLAYRNAVELTLARWNSDVALLIPALQSYVHHTPATAAQTVHAAVPVQLPAPESPAIDRVIRSKRSWIAGAAVAAVLIISAALYFFLSSRATQTAPAAATAQFSVPLPYNATGIYADGAAFSQTSGIGGSGNAYHPFEKLIAPGTQNMTLADGTIFTIGPTGAPDVVQTSLNQPTVITIPPQKYSTLAILGASTNGPAPAQSFWVTYSTRTALHKQGMSDWAVHQQQLFSNEQAVITQTYANNFAGTQQPGHFLVYEYRFKLDNTIAVQSISLPQNNNIVILAATLVP